MNPSKPYKTINPIAIGRNKTLDRGNTITLQKGKSGLSKIKEIVHRSPSAQRKPSFVLPFTTIRLDPRLEKIMRDNSKPPKQTHVKREAPISDKGDVGEPDNADDSFFGDLTSNINKGIMKT